MTGAALALADGDFCDEVSLALNNETTETVAELILELDPDTVGGKLTAEVPPFCRATGTASPVEGARIGFEIWLPEKDWNGRLLMFGNGGYSSKISYDKAERALSKGYAVALTDTGHEGNDPIFGKGHPEAIVDWAHRAVHETALRGKAAIAAYYGKGPNYSYFDDCSTGGQQAFSKAQRYPEDFNVILAGERRATTTPI
ncbi:tannase/feruloyl esterase family alpha/beta hydrolase [Breoghania sp.]|uniref:tannase/feruloyl esterase family alpha/beta hydrolase n=1 Tax=Breoghania sp. TaxID=2065378 RepID=UPI00261C5C2E|nr:tannase/feruloyl esterase family alpha/beta hydrolase [Breoghania sp.]MDJ0931380.1 tannase/feruloyl esterase family alpha/beta hydrolase [Breoghania sp.]